MNKKNYFFPGLLISYFIASLALFLYSYTQVDLNLTLSRVSIWQTVQKSFQHIGYFQRPLSASIYLVILAAFFFLYFLTAGLVRKISRQEIWILIITVTVLLVFSYPAFSYDMFNYMFTAKTVLLYHKNPYDVIPLQFAGVDAWVNFMRWTHLPSAYTPLWILLTLPAYFFGFGYFLIIMWNIKLLVAGFYLLTVWLIERIMTGLNPGNQGLTLAKKSMIIFALNPLILIECLVSSHNDVVMMALVMMAIILYLNKKVTSSFFVWALSVAAKLMTLFLLPAYIFRWNRIAALAFIVFGFILVLFQREVLPWYWVWAMPFVALLPQFEELTFLGGSVSLGLLLRYAPYLYKGDYNPPVPLLNNLGTIIPIILAIVGIFIHRYLIKNSLKKA